MINCVAATPQIRPGGRTRGATGSYGTAPWHAADLNALAPLTRLLAGAPLPAKANLTVRWARAADREAGYVHVANPLAPPGPHPGPLWPEPTHARGRG
ncbi:hypothetical protein [Microbispora sp. CA-102843]|uniref:hypothetical protein n=1 Tax=Microbispora sp. CA-102843 TaxID=3239952 RepID=UPI003D8C7ED9